MAHTLNAYTLKHLCLSGAILTKELKRFSGCAKTILKENGKNKRV